MTKVLAHRILKPDEHGRGWCRVIGNWRDGDATKKTLDYIRQYHGGNCIVQRAYSEPGDCISVHPTPITPFYPLPKEQPMEELRGSGNEFLRRVAREGDPGASVSMSVADLQHLFKRLDNAEQTAQDQKERCRNLLRQTASDQDIIDELEAKLTEARGHNTELRKKVDAQLTDRAPTAQQTLEFACAAHAKAIGTPVFEIEYGNRDNAIYHGAQRDVITMAAANLLGKWQRNGGGLANGPLEVQLARVWLTVFPLNPA